MSFYQDNIDLLCLKHPNFKSNILGKYDKSSNFIISDSRSGLPTATVDGKLIHSNREPAREAEKLVIAEVPEKSSACIVEGFGLGYYVEAILRLRPGVPVIIVEPSPERFLKALDARSLKSIINSPSVSLLIGNDSESIRLLLPGLPKGSIQLFKHRALYELNSEFFGEIDKIVQHFISRRDVNTATLKKFGKLWVRNLIHNLNMLPQAMDVGKLASTFGDFPVLLLAAGPSLDSVLPYMDELQKRFIIVAVDTSAAVLINTGFLPDFTVVVDPQYWNIRHLDRIDLGKTILMSESSTHPGIFRKNHRKMFFCGSLFPLGIFIEKYGGSKKRLGAGGSVATTAWDFCRLISNGHLFCGGLDLGFPENKTHFHGSFFEEKVHIETSRIAPPEDYTFKAISSGNPFYIANNTGTLTLTDSRLSIYIQWFEEQIKINKISNIWNISPLGIKIEGMDYKDIKKLLNYPDIREEIDNIRERIEISSTDAVKTTKQTLIHGTNILKDELERLSTLSNKGISLISEYKGGDQGDISVPMLLKGLDEIDNQIMGSDSREITSFLLQPIINEIADKDRVETFDEGIEESIMLYSRIRESADFHLELVLSYLQNHNN